MEPYPNQKFHNPNHNQFYFEEIVDVIDKNKNEVYEGKITSVRGQLLIITLTKTNQEIRCNISDNFVLKQWSPGRPFNICNRVDLKDLENDKWVEGIVTNIDDKKELVEIRYLRKDPVTKEMKYKKTCLSQTSYRLDRPGNHSNKTGKVSYDSQEINKRLFGKRKSCKMNEKQENNFQKNMTENHLEIHHSDGDGNCLFRSISDQVYGDEQFHAIIREKCMDYIQEEKLFFQQFIEGGENEIDEYIQMKRTLGVWGDDIELQALSEIYNRPIEIYLNSKNPLKSFHENNSGFNRIKNEQQDKSNLVIRFPIRISYHGKQHYNSLIPFKTSHEYSLYVNSLITQKPGEYEDEQIIKVKQIKIHKKEKEEKEKAKEAEELDKSRQLFKENNINKHCLDDYLLDEDIEIVSDNNNPNKREDSSKDLKKVLKESELKKNEEDLINSAIQMSLESSNMSTNNKNNQNDFDYLSIPGIQTALEFGFSLDDAILAYSIYGTNSDAMLQYLYSMKDSQNDYI